MIEARSFSPRCAIAWLSSREKNFKTPRLVVRHFFFVFLFVFISSFLFFYFFLFLLQGMPEGALGDSQKKL